MLNLIFIILDEFNINIKNKKKYEWLSNCKHYKNYY